MSGGLAEEFLRFFFGASNELSYEDAVESARFGQLTPWVEDLRSGRFPVMLPRVRSGSTTWYGLADSSLGLREMWELLGAFVGPTYTSLRGGSLPLNPQDPIDTAVEGFCNGRVVKFEVWPRGGSEHQQIVRDRLLTMRALRIRAPLRIHEPARPTWRVIRDLELALEDRNRDAAESYFDELSASHALGEPNFTFLRVRLCEAFHQWEDLLRLKQLPSLLHVARPPKVTAAILTAIHEVVVEPALAAEPDLPEVAQEIEALYGPLVHADPRPVTKATGSVVLLAAMFAQPQREEQGRRILDQMASNEIEADPRLLGALPGQDFSYEQRGGEARDLLIAAEEALAYGDHDRALDMATRAESGERQVWVLIRAAATIQSLTSARAALESISQLAAEDRKRFEDSPISGRILERLRGLAPKAGAIPSGWIEWAEAIVHGSGLSSARDVAERGASEWDSTLSDSELRLLGDLMAGAPNHAVPGVVRSVPHLLAAFPIEDARPAHLPLYVALLERLAVEGQVSSQDLASSLSLLDGTLRIGPTADEYKDIIEICQMLWEAAASPWAIDWFIDVMQVLVHHPCAAPDRRRAFVVAALSRLSQWPSSLDPAAVAGLATVGEVLSLDIAQLLPQIPETGEEDVRPDPWASLKGRRVGIYTLTESASSRASEVIHRLTQDAQVDTNHDHVCTEQLASLSGEADLMVVVTHSATHAATDCIADHRGSGRTIYPAGKGSSSIIRAIEDDLRATTFS